MHTIDQPEAATIFLTANPPFCCRAGNIPSRFGEREDIQTINFRDNHLTGKPFLLSCCYLICARYMSISMLLVLVLLP